MKEKLSIICVIIILSVGVLSGPSALATDNDRVAERGMTTGISLGLSDSDKWSPIGLVVRPNIGYRFSRAWETGVYFKYEKSRGDDVYNVSLYGEYNFFPFKNDNFSMFVDLQAGRGWLPVYYDAELGVKTPSTTSVEVGFVPGMKYHIPGTKADLRLRYLFVGFNNYRGSYNRDRACLHTGDFVLDASLHRLELGISVNF